jgi:hypothetical protein
MRRIGAQAPRRVGLVGKLGLPGLIVWALASMPRYAAATTDITDEGIELELSPRVCTLSARDQQCNTVVRARWSAPQEESLCLVIIDRPEVKQCWEHYEAGAYTVELVFAQDLTFQLRDPALQHVLASEVLRVIREAILYRHKRRQPWNIFD